MSSFIFMLDIIILIPLLAICQNNKIFVPVDIKPLYNNHTRTLTGMPGPDYWQNHSDYKIEVELIPEKRMIRGKEFIKYYNESPDTLRQIVIRLYKDIMKKGQYRDFNVDPLDLNDGMQIYHLKINNQKFDKAEIDTSDMRKGTNLIIDLDQPIAPSAKADIEVKWSFVTTFYKNIRAGAYDSTSFMIAYWYPQIAVYDDVDGWDRFDYSGLQEFYNDFNNYEVSITVPGNFLVWATGKLLNADDVLAKKYYQKYEEALSSDSIISIVNEDDLNTNQITKNKNKNIWMFRADHVPDFVFSTSDHYLWDQTSLEVGPDKRRVKIGAAYNSSSEDFYKVAEIARKAIDYFSTEMPGIPYPYPSMTVFNGSGGMEFPMMVNDGSTPTMPRTISLTSHEIAHSYFPFYMGTNERKYAWMDEGWAVMLPFNFVLQQTGDYDRRAVNATEYAYLAGKELDIPIMVLSIAYGGQIYRPSYRLSNYTKAAMAYQMLRDLLGEDLFMKALHTYIKRWHGKHPIPYDFFFTFDNVAGENLSWFWNPLFFERGYPDLAIGKVQNNDKNLSVTIKRLGNVPVPVYLKTIFADDSETLIERKADIWKNGAGEITFQITKQDSVKRLQLGNKYIPDIDLKNNSYNINNK
ncbi:MAG: M1 family metallopeptidase [Calditrichaceae bacterium]